MRRSSTRAAHRWPEIGMCTRTPSTEYGTGVLTVHNEMTLQWRYIHSTDMAVADEFYITNTH